MKYICRFLKKIFFYKYKPVSLTQICLRGVTEHIMTQHINKDSFPVSHIWVILLDLNNAEGMVVFL